MITVHYVDLEPNTFLSPSLSFNGMHSSSTGLQWAGCKCTVGDFSGVA